MAADGGFRRRMALEFPMRRLSKGRIANEKAKTKLLDMFAVRKGHRYMTDIVDLQTGRILYAANGKDGAAIILGVFRDWGRELFAKKFPPPILSPNL